MINLLLGFGLFVGSSVPQGETAIDTPSGISIVLEHEYKFNYWAMTALYRRDNYQLRMVGIGAGKEFILGNHFSFLLTPGIIYGSMKRKDVSENGIFPVFSLRFLYLFPSKNPKFQIGFSLKEIFDEEIGTDFLDIGIGFRLQ